MMSNASAKERYKGCSEVFKSRNYPVAKIKIKKTKEFRPSRLDINKEEYGSSINH